MLRQKNKIKMSKLIQIIQVFILCLFALSTQAQVLVLDDCVDCELSVSDTDVDAYYINTTGDSLCISENGKEECLPLQDIFNLSIFEAAVFDLISVDSSYSVSGCLDVLPLPQPDGSVNFQFGLDYQCIQTQLDIPVSKFDSLISADTCLIVTNVLGTDGAYTYTIDFNPNCIGSSSVDKYCVTVFDTVTIEGNLIKLAFNDCYEDDVFVSRDTALKECLNCVQDINHNSEISINKIDNFTFEIRDSLFKNNIFVSVTIDTIIQDNEIDCSTDHLVLLFPKFCP